MDRRELRVRCGDALAGGGSTLVLFDVRPEAPSVFLFPAGGGGERGEFEEGVTDDVEAGMMGTLPMAISSLPATVGTGIAGEGGGGKDGESEEGVTDDVETGTMGTLPMTMSLPSTTVANGIAGEPVAEMPGLEMRGPD